MSAKETEQPNQFWVFGVIIPAAILTVGLSIFLAMGSSKPKQVPAMGNDPASLLSRMSIVSTANILDYPSDQTLDLDLTGTVVPFRQVTLAAEVDGRVLMKSPLCKVGRFVQAGDTLYKVDPKDYELDVKRLATMRDSEYAQQRELDQEVANAQRSLEIAEEDVSLHDRDLKRMEALPNGFSSATELDQIRRLRLSSMNQKQTVQNQMDMLKTRRNRLTLAEQLAATELEQATINLLRTEMKAPISGVIVSESIEQDSYVKKGATLCEIDDTSRVEVAVNLRADQLLLILDQHAEPNSAPDDLNQGASYELPPTRCTVSYRVAGRDDMVYQWDGVLSRYDGIGLDSSSRTVPVRVTVENPRAIKRNGKPVGDNAEGAPPALVKGMFVDCAIHTRPKRKLVLLPKLALRPGNQVWKFIEDKSLLTPDKSEGEKDKPSEGLSSTKTNQDAKSSSSDEVKLIVDDWVPGRIKIVEDIRVIRTTYWPAEKIDGNLIDNRKEYWIAESVDTLPVGGSMITTPLANIIGDGTDKVRYHLK